jgi:PIN domain nuclease of toxin-antitoxin system
MPIVAIADTHAVIWYLFADARLSALAKAQFDMASAAGQHIGVSSMIIVEIIYLTEKNRIPADTLIRLQQGLGRPNPVLVEVPFNNAIAFSVAAIPRTQVPDMPDRIISATAVHLRLPLISRDGKIQLSQVPTIW